MTDQTALLMIHNLTEIDDNTWTELSLYAEHNELTLDYVLSEFYVNGHFMPVNVE